MQIVDGSDRLDDVKQLIIEYTNSLNRDLSFQSLDAELSDIAAKYTAPNGRIICADVDGKTVGCVAYRRLTDTVCEMKRLYVSPNYRKLHIGGRLIDEILRLAKEDGYKKMVLDTITPLQSAVHLYKKHGFAECEPYYDNPMDDVIYLEKVL